MKISQTLLPEYDHEMATTRKLLERVPEDRFGWQPHDKSMTLGRLATHLAELPGLGLRITQADSLDLNPPDGSGGYKPTTLGSRQEILDTFDSRVAAAREAIASLEDQEMMKPWSLLNGGRPIFTLPKAAVLRSMLLSHSIHHRGQLSVYLRLNDVPVPSIYGPSADES